MGFAASAKGYAKERAKSSYPLLCAVRVARNVEIQLRALTGNWKSSATGTQNAARDIEGAVSYIDEVFSDYRRYSGLARFYGRVAEVGPGDNAGVALRFLEDGCEEVELLDRFRCARDIEKNLAIYRTLAERSEPLRERLGDLDLKQADDEPEFPRIRRHYGPSAAVERHFEIHTDYDFIVSRAVLEHVDEPVHGLKMMARALRPGGMLLHKVDLRDHGMFSFHFHELKFLEVPKPVYTAMTWRSGRPNRVLVDAYREALASIPGLDSKILVTRLVGVGDIEPHLPYDEISPEVRAASLRAVREHKARFAHDFRQKSDEDLSVAGIFIIAKRP